MADEKKAEFKLISKANDVIGKNGNVVLVSRQSITQSSGNVSEFVVVRKVKKNQDGSQNGRPTQVFIPVDLTAQVIDAIKSLSSK